MDLRRKFQTRFGIIVIFLGLSCTTHVFVGAMSKEDCQVKWDDCLGKTNSLAEAKKPLWQGSTFPFSSAFSKFLPAKQDQGMNSEQICDSKILAEHGCSSRTKPAAPATEKHSSFSSKSNGNEAEKREQIRRELDKTDLGGLGTSSTFLDRKSGFPSPFKFPTMDAAKKSKPKTEDVEEKPAPKIINKFPEDEPEEARRSTESRKPKVKSEDEERPRPRSQEVEVERPRGREPAARHEDENEPKPETKVAKPIVSATNDDAEVKPIVKATSEDAQVKPKRGRKQNEDPVDEPTDKRGPIDESGRRPANEYRRRNKLDDEEEPNRRPVDDDQLKRRPVDEDQPKRRPVDEDQPKRRPVDEDQPKRRPVDEDQPKRRPVEEDQPKRRPVDEDQPKRRPVDEDQPKRRPVDEDQPKRRPVDEDQPKRRPVDEQSRRRPVDEDQVAGRKRQRNDDMDGEPTRRSKTRAETADENSNDQPRQGPRSQKGRPISSSENTRPAAQSEEISNRPRSGRPRPTSSVEVDKSVRPKQGKSSRPADEDLPDGPEPKPEVIEEDSRPKDKVRENPNRSGERSKGDGRGRKRNKDADDGRTRSLGSVTAAPPVIPKAVTATPDVKNMTTVKPPIKATGAPNAGGVVEMIKAIVPVPK